MGACNFYNRAKGTTLREAFRAEVDLARWVHGHGGYTGTIAEKHEVVEVRVPNGVAPEAFANMVLAALSDDKWTSRGRYLDLDKSIIDAVNRAAAQGEDKWGPAVAVQVAPGVWDIMGWASS